MFYCKQYRKPLSPSHTDTRHYAQGDRTVTHVQSLTIRSGYRLGVFPVCHYWSGFLRLPHEERDWAVCVLRSESQWPHVSRISGIILTTQVVRICDTVIFHLQQLIFWGFFPTGTFALAVSNRDRTICVLIISFKRAKSCQVPPDMDQLRSRPDRLRVGGSDVWWASLSWRDEWWLVFLFQTNKKKTASNNQPCSDKRFRTGWAETASLQRSNKLPVFTKWPLQNGTSALFQQISVLLLTYTVGYNFECLEIWISIKIVILQFVTGSIRWLWY